MLRTLILLFLAGGVGTLLRYAVVRGVGVGASGFPWGTFVVNAAGCLACGILWAALDARQLLDGELRTVLLVGFLGAVTTFSAFALDIVTLAQDGKVWLAGAYAVGANALGVLALVSGIALARVTTLA